MREGFKVTPTCTGQGTHKRKVFDPGIVMMGTIQWKHPLIDIDAAEVWKGEAGHVARYRFRCPICKRPWAIREDTLLRAAEALATATRRTRAVDIDLSMLT